MVCWSQLRLPVEIFIVNNQNLPVGVKLQVVCNWPRWPLVSVVDQGFPYGLLVNTLQSTAVL